MLKKFVFALAVVALFNDGNVQLIVIGVLIAFYCVYIIIIKPYSQSRFNTLSIVNEILVLMIYVFVAAHNNSPTDSRSERLDRS